MDVLGGRNVLFVQTLNFLNPSLSFSLSVSVLLNSCFYHPDSFFLSS